MVPRRIALTSARSGRGTGCHVLATSGLLHRNKNRERGVEQDMTTYRDCGAGPEPQRLILPPGPTSDELMKSHDTIPCPETRGERCKCEGLLRGNYGELPEGK